MGVGQGVGFPLHRCHAASAGFGAEPQGVGVVVGVRFLLCVMFADLSASPLFSAPLGTGKYDGCYGNEVTCCWGYVGVVVVGGGVEGMVTSSV